MGLTIYHYMLFDCGHSSDEILKKYTEFLDLVINLSQSLHTKISASKVAKMRNNVPIFDTLYKSPTAKATNNIEINI